MGDGTCWSKSWKSSSNRSRKTSRTRKEGPDIEAAIVNLMKICIKRQDGNVLSGQQDTRIDNIYETVFKRYLMIEGKGRLIKQILVGLLAVIMNF